MIDQEKNSQSMSQRRFCRTSSSVEQLEKVLSLPAKQQAWSDLIRSTNDGNSSVRSRVAEAFGSTFFSSTIYNYPGTVCIYGRL